MRDRKIQRMVRRGEITHAEGERMAAVKAAKSAPAKEEPIDFRNSERYADPTAFFAMHDAAHRKGAGAAPQLQAAHLPQNEGSPLRLRTLTMRTLDIRSRPFPAEAEGIRQPIAQDRMVDVKPEQGRSLPF